MLTLPTVVETHASADMEALWERFEVFEALHHLMRICNPMTERDVMQLADILGPADGESALDIACGHGELLIQLAERAEVEAVGIDLSPWVFAHAVAEARRRAPDGRFRWIVGEAREAVPDLFEDHRFDVVTCLGASWIWHGFRGTVEACARQSRRGGRVAVGDLRLRDGADLTEVVETYGRVLTAAEQRQIIEDAGLEIIDRIDPGDAAWDAYQTRIDASARAWLAANPGSAAERYVADQQAWRADHDRDMEFLDWTVWVARCA